MAHQHKDTEFNPPYTWDNVPIIVLQDIRDELKRLNSLLNCRNFINIPLKLERIARNTSKPRKKKAAEK